MLVLTRQRDEAILIGDQITITVVDVRGEKVRIGISAPKTVSVHRKEVYDAIHRENRAAAQVRPQDLGPAVGPAGTQTPRTYGFAGIACTVLAAADAYSMLELRFAPGAAWPVHVQTRYDLVYQFIENTLRLDRDGQPTDAPAGTVVHIPRGTRHGLMNAGTAQARVLVTCTPGGLETLFQEIGRPLANLASPPTPAAEDRARLAAAAPRYGIELSPQSP